jgi:hypothetical protein
MRGPRCVYRSNVLFKRVVAFKKCQCTPSGRNYIGTTKENAVLNNHRRQSQEKSVDGSSHTISNTKARGGAVVLCLIEWATTTQFRVVHSIDRIDDTHVAYYDITSSMMTSDYGSYDYFRCCDSRGAISLFTNTTRRARQATPPSFLDCYT